VSVAEILGHTDIRITSTRTACKIVRPWKWLKSSNFAQNWTRTHTEQVFSMAPHY